MIAFLPVALAECAFMCDYHRFVLMFKEEDPQAGSLTGWKSMPNLLAKSYASPVAAGWIKGRTMGPLSGTFSQICFRQRFTHHVGPCKTVHAKHAECFVV